MSRGPDTHMDMPPTGPHQRASGFGLVTRCGTPGKQGAPQPTTYLQGCVGQEGSRAASHLLGSDPGPSITQNDAAFSLCMNLGRVPVSLRKTGDVPENPCNLGPFTCLLWAPFSWLTYGSRDTGQAPMESSWRWGQGWGITVLLPGHPTFTLASPYSPPNPSQLAGTSPNFSGHRSRMEGTQDLRHRPGLEASGPAHHQGASCQASFQDSIPAPEQLGHPTPSLGLHIMDMRSRKTLGAQTNHLWEPVGQHQQGS